MHIRKSTTAHPLKKHKCHQPITHNSYFHYLLTQLFHHDSNVTNLISFPDHHNLLSVSLHPKHLRANYLISYPVSNINQHKLLPFNSSYLYFTSQPAHQGTNHYSRYIASYVCNLLDVELQFPLGRQVSHIQNIELFDTSNNQLP